MANIRYCDRHFGSAAEMDEAILDRVNESVKANDELYFLGDYFILGNDDRVMKKLVDQFVWVKEIAEVNVRNQPIVLCHFAMRVWHHSGRGACSDLLRNNASLASQPAFKVMESKWTSQLRVEATGGRATVAATWQRGGLGDGGTRNRSRLQRRNQTSPGRTRI